MIRGLDVSKYQPNVDWSGVKFSGVRFALIQAQRGNDEASPTFDKQVAGAREQGIDVGSYLYVYPLPNAAGHVNRDPVGQAQLYFQAAAGLGGDQGDLPPAIDAENPDVPNFAEWNCSPQQIADWLLTCAQQVTTLFGRKPMIYTNDYYWGAVAKCGAVSDFAQYVLWLSQYPGRWDNVAPTDGTPFPKAPAPWSKVTLWQHGAKLSCPGGGLVDGNVFNGTEAEYQALLVQP